MVNRESDRDFCPEESADDEGYPQLWESIGSPPLFIHLAQPDNFANVSASTNDPRAISSGVAYSSGR